MSGRFPLLGLLLAALAGCSNDSAPSASAPGAAGSASRGGSGGASAGAGAGSGGTAGQATGGSAAGNAGTSGGGAGGSSEPPWSTDNLLVNGDAEQGTTGWLSVDAGSAIRSLKYGDSSYPSSTDAGPAERGSRFFDGGDNARTDSHQSVDVSAFAVRIEQGLRYRLSAYLGGYLAQDDRASVVVRCLASDGSLLSQSVLGGPLAAERLSTTGLFAYQLDAKLPPLTQTLDVHLVMTRAGGTGSDGYADNLTLVLHD